MSYFEPYIDADGIHIPTYQETMDHLIESYKGIFGANVYLEADSPDYQLLSIFARCLDDAYSLAVDVYNARNINYATGNSLDLLLPLIAMTRNAATPSRVYLTLHGRALTTVPAGSKAIDEAGYLWSLETDVTFDSSGLGNGYATCDTAGAIKALAGTVNRIYSPVADWTSVTNENAAVPGKDLESDADVRIRQKYAMSAHGTTTVESLKGILMDLDGVQDAVVHENNTSAVDSLSCPGHSISCVVYGGEDSTVAEAIYKKKAPGIGTYGDVAVQIADSYGEAHTINFFRPTPVQVTFTVNITKLANFDEELTEETIRSTIGSFLDDNPIGQDLINGQLIALCYAAQPEIASSYVLSSIAVTANGSTVTDMLELGWKDRLELADGGITFVYAN